jgi:hypothetical protein
MIMGNPTFDLTFQQAMDKLFKEKYFIRGDNFRPGYYIKCGNNGNAILVDANKFNKEIWDVTLSAGLLTQNYRAFPVANQAIY